MKNTVTLLVLIGVLIGRLPGFGQQVQPAATGQAFSLQQAIQFALQNQTSIKNAQINNEIAKAKIGQIRSAGLPQLNGGIEVGNNVVLQRVLVDPSAFGGGSREVLNEVVIPGEQVKDGQTIRFTPSTRRESISLPPQALAFGLQYAGSAAVNGSQLLFDGSYLIGLKAAKVYTDLSTKQLQQTETDVIDQVTKAYYGVLVTQERIALLDRNLDRLATLLKETTEIQKQGFAEKIDVDRLQVTYNNLKVEKDKADRLLVLSNDLLKFQMGMELKQPLTLTDKLDNVIVDAQVVASENFNYSNRIEYSILETQRDLSLLNIKNKKAGYYPSVLLNGRYGYSGSSNSFGDLARFSTEFNGEKYSNWFNFAYIGLSVQVPIFDGLRKKYEIQEAKLNLQAVENGFNILKQSIDLQLNQANTNLKNALQVIDVQKQSLALAEEVARVSNIKFKEGVGSNLEVVTAETELRQAQTNYFSAVYDALIAKTDLQKATGTLKK